MADDDRSIVDRRESLRRANEADRGLLTSRLRALARPTQRESGLEALTYRPAAQESSGYGRIRHDLYRGLVEILNPQAVAKATIDQVQAAIDEYLDNAIAANNLPLSAAERAQLAGDLLYEILGLGPLTPLMTDPTITDILVNGTAEVFVERKGILELTDVRFNDEEHLMLTIERILMGSGRRVDEATPLADARLPDGSRVNVIIPPLAVRGPSISIRRFAVRNLTLDALAGQGAISRPAAEFLKLAVRARLNIVVSGGTGSGKTTLLNALAEHIPARERIITIEDTAELRLPHPHLVALEARPPNVEGLGAIPIRALVRNALRMRPDRIIVGESRGPEALDMLQAMNTGHDGSMTTLHANAPRDALARLETMMLMADVDLPQRVLRDQIGSALHLVVHLARLQDGSRRIMNITEVAGVDDGVVLTQDLFTTRRDERGEVRMRPMGTTPSFKELMYQNGKTLDDALFREPA